MDWLILPQSRCVSTAVLLCLGIKALLCLTVTSGARIHYDTARSRGQVDPDSVQIDPDSVQIDPDSVQIDPDSVQIDPTQSDIPRVYHHIVCGYENLTTNQQRHFASCVEATRGFDVITWTCVELEAVLKQLDLHDRSLTFTAQQTHYARVVAVLYLHGGVYVDVNVGCRHDVSKLYQQMAYHMHATVALAYSDYIGVFPKLIISQQRHPLMHDLIKHMTGSAETDSLARRFASARQPSVYFNAVFEAYVDCEESYPPWNCRHGNTVVYLLRTQAVRDVYFTNLTDDVTATPVDRVRLYLPRCGVALPLSVITLISFIGVLLSRECQTE